MTLDSSTFAELQALRANYGAALPGRLAVLEQQWNKRHVPEVLATLHFQFHSLAGSGATFGFTELGRSARRLETLLKQVLAGERKLEGDTATEAAALFEALRQAATRPDAKSHAVPEGRRPGSEQPDEIVLLDPDPGAGDELATQLDILGYPCRVARTEAALRELVGTATPLAAVIDPGQDYSFAPLLDGAGNPVPLVFVSPRDDFSNRLQGVRAGGHAWITRPADALAVAAVLDDLHPRGPREAHRILVIDDDEALARYYALTLQNAGMETRIVTDPMLVMKTVREFKPDLLLMDLYMPGCNGLELAAVIRQQQAFIGIPIVFLSGETDGDKQLAAMSRGADDFLNKSISAERLVGSVAARVTRSRSMRALMVSDSLTGLYNHSYIKEQLAQELSRAARQGSSLAFAMLDIDKFKAVNDNHGHLAGDRVIKALARHLKQRLRNSDVIGRYGGEEFAVIFPATTAEAAANILDDLRAGFFSLRHHTEHGNLVVSFSCGVADYPRYTDAQALNDAADKALYRAKQTGRNRVVLAPALREM